MNMNSSTTTQNASSASRQPASQGAVVNGQTCDQLKPVDDIVDYVTTYARQNPGTAAVWCFGIGFIVGWKLKPW